MTVLAAVASPSCSILLSDDGKQCHDDRECARFGDVVCNTTAGICIPRPSFGNGGDAGRTTDARPADGGTAAGGAGFARDGASLMDGVAPSHTPTSPDGSAGSAEVSGTRECPDLDVNGVLDCKESQVINPDFKYGLTGWTPEPEMNQAFIMSDAGGGQPAGSLAVINGTVSATTVGSTTGGSKQCVAVRASTRYDLFLEVLATAPPDGTVSAGAICEFYAGDSCTGTLTGTLMPPRHPGVPAAWRKFQSLVPVPGGTLSMLLRLVVVKPLNQAPTPAQFDNILLKPH